MEKLSKRQQGERNALAVKNVVDDCIAGKIVAPINERTGLAHRERFAELLGFKRAVWSQNPAALEELLRLDRFLSKSTDAPAMQGQSLVATDAKRIRELEGEVNRLRSRNAALSAENAELRQRLMGKEIAHEHSIETGRLIRS